MTRETFEEIRNYMLDMMKDCAHDYLHIYRVLYQALKISENYEVDKDVLIASCLLHDIGRSAEYQNKQLCHAVEGGKLAYEFMKQLGWEESQCLHIKDCITTHRYRTGNFPKTIEAKILFDSDKLDVTGALGIARSLIYKGQVGEPLYTIDDDFQIQNTLSEDMPESFLKEYHFKLSKLYDRFFTPEAAALAQKRKKVTDSFYHELIEEIEIMDIGEYLDLGNM